VLLFSEYSIYQLYKKLQQNCKKILPDRLIHKTGCNEKNTARDLNIEQDNLSFLLEINKQLISAMQQNLRQQFFLIFPDKTFHIKY